MKIIIVKLIKDLRLIPGKLILMILAGVLSSWGISCMIYSFYMTERDFKVNFQQTYPADLSITVDNFQSGLEVDLLKDPDIVDVERREAISARIKNQQGSWMPVVIYGVEDPGNMRYDQFRILDESVTESGSIYVEQNSFYFLDKDEDSLQLQFTGHQETISWKIGGKVHDARLAPSKMEGVVYAYTRSIDLLEPYLKPDRRRLLIKTSVTEERDKLELVLGRVKTLTEGLGAEVVAYKIPEPGKHMHQGIVDGIAFLQLSGGSVLSTMGIILLSLIILIWVFPQISDIGVMKAMGADARSIFISFTVVLSLIVIMGMFIGLPLGYKSAKLYSGFVAGIQNFEVVDSLLPIYIHLPAILITFIIPVGFGIQALFKAARITVNQAINKTFHTPDGLLLKISRSWDSPELKYKVNNLVRQTPRTVLMLLLISSGFALFFTASNTSYSIRSDLEQFAQSARYEIGLLLPDSLKKNEVGFLKDLPFVKSIAPVNTSRVSYIPPHGTYPEISAVRVLSSQFKLDPELMQRGAVDRSCTDCIYVSGENMRHQFLETPLGAPVELVLPTGISKTYKFSGVIRDLVAVSAPFFVFNDQQTQKFNSLAIELTTNLSNEEIMEASNLIDDAFLGHDINLRQRTSVKMRMLAIMNHLEPTFLVIKIMGICTILLGLIGLLLVLNLTLQERTREFGIMKSLGASVKKISILIRQEFLYITLLASIAGMIFTLPMTNALTKLIAETIIRHPVNFQYDTFQIFISIALVLGLQTLLISIYGHFKIRQNARELLDHNF